MEISKSKMFKTLYKKDLMLARTESLLIAAVIVIANLFLIYKTQTKWPGNITFILSLMLLGFIPLTIFFKAFTSIGAEWKENTVYLMMSLPVSSNIIFLSKLLALFTQLVLLGIIALPFTGFLFFSSAGSIYNVKEVFEILRSMTSEVPGEYVIFITQILILAALSYLYTITVVLFSSVVGRMVHKYSGLITAATFIGINILLNNIISGIMYLISNFINITEANMLKYLNNYGMPLMILGTAGLTVGFFFLTTFLYDKKIEL